MTLLALGDARRQNDEPEPARQAYTAAIKLYTACESPLGEAEAARAEASLLLENAETEAANGRFARAMELVERVGDGLRDAEGKQSFYDSYAALYAEAIVAAARESNEARASELARTYAGRAGRAGKAAANQSLRQAEQAITARVPEQSKEDVERNKAIAKTLANARKLLG